MELEGFLLVPTLSDSFEETVKYFEAHILCVCVIGFQAGTIELGIQATAIDAKYCLEWADNR